MATQPPAAAGAAPSSTAAVEDDKPKSRPPPQIQTGPAVTGPAATEPELLSEPRGSSTTAAALRPAEKPETGELPPVAAAAASTQEVAHPTKPTVTTTTATLIGAKANAKIDTTKMDEHQYGDDVNPPDFEGAVDSNNEIPSAEVQARIENYVVLDRDGKSHPFKSLYMGKHAARRVLVIFVRHFFCGNCQEYIRALSASITPEALLRLPISTFITIIGCGDPGLIDMYAAATNCQFPIYADPTRKLYQELGMIRTLALGPRPAYMKHNLFTTSMQSIVQGLKQLKNGLATKAGDSRQIGGEFMFEPLDLQSPVGTPHWEKELEKHQPLGLNSLTARTGSVAGSETSLDGKNESTEGLEEKRITWCHRMKTTRDHAEIPELCDILGLDSDGMPIFDKKRWSRALQERKGTGLTMASAMSELNIQMNSATSASRELP